MDLMTLVAKFTADTSQFEKGIKSAQSTMEQGKAAAEKLDATLGKLKTAFAGVVTVAGVAKVANAVKGLADSTSAAADRIDKQSQALGMSRKAFQQWDYILGQSGASIDSLGVSMKTLNTSLLNPQEGTITALNTLGINLEQIQGLSQEDAFEMMVRQFQKLPEGATKSALAMQMFGKQGQALMPLLNSSEDSIDSLRKEMDRLGFTMSDAMVDAGVKYGDTLDNLNRAFGGLKSIIGYGFMEPLTGIMEEVTNFFSQQDVQDAVKRFAVSMHDLGNVVLDHVRGFFEWLTEHSGEIQTIVSNVGEFVADIAGVVLPALAAYAAFKLITNPLALISAGVAAIAANWPSIKEFFTSKVPEWVNQTFGIDLTQIKLPTLEEVTAQVSAWWNGGEGGGGIKEKVAALLDWYLQAPGEPQGDPVAVVKAWWEQTKERVQEVVKWALSLPSAPREGGMRLRLMVKQWWSEQVTKLQQALVWVLNLPKMPEVTGENGIVTKLQKWWTDFVIPALEGHLEFTLGLLGMPDAETTLASITEWWNGIKESTGDLIKVLFGVDTPAPEEIVTALTTWWNSVTTSLGELFNTLFGVDLPDFETIVSDIQTWWNSVLKSLGDYIHANFGIKLPSISDVRDTIQGWWNNIISGLSLVIPSFWGGGGSGGTLGRYTNPADPTTSAGSYFKAAGMDYVPRNGMPVTVHEGEAILNKRDAEEWRRGGNRGATASQIAEALASTLEGMNVVMDGSIVGRLTAKAVSREIEREARAGRFATA